MLDQALLKLIEDEGHVSEKYIHELLWRRGDLEFLLWPQQVAIWETIHTLPPDVVKFVILSARQFGKSMVMVLWALTQALKNRDCCILIMAPDIKQGKAIVLPRMRLLCKTAPKGLIVPMKAENKFHVYHDLNRKADDFTEIVIGGFNENSSSQRGKTLHCIAVEEIVDVPENQFSEAMESDLGPAMTHSKGGKIGFFTTPPKYPDHPFLLETVVKAELQNAISRFTIYDNIALDKQQFDNCVEFAGGIGTTAWKREYMCEVVRDRSLVCLPDFDKQVNVREFTLPTWRFMSVAIDWGGVRDKTAGTIYTYDYLNDIDMFWDENVNEPNTPTSVIVAEMKAKEEGHEISARWIDAPQQLVSIDLQEDKYGYIASVPVKIDWEAALNTLNMRMKQGKVWIHPRCKFLIQSANSGTMNKLRTDLARTEALGHMDGVMAMAYAVRMQNKENPYPAVSTDPLIMARSNQNPGLVSPELEIVPTPLYQDPFASQTPRNVRAFGKHRRSG